MPVSVRLNKDEQKELHKKSIEINKMLIEKEKKPVAESDLAHFVLEKMVKFIKVDKNGEIFIDY